MNPWREEMDQLRLDTDHESVFISMDGLPRVFHLSDLMSRVYGQFSHAVQKVITKKSQQYLGTSASHMQLSSSFKSVTRHIIIYCCGFIAAFSKTSMR